MDEKILPVGTKVMMSDRELLEMPTKASGETGQIVQRRGGDANCYIQEVIYG